MNERELVEVWDDEGDALVRAMVLLRAKRLSGKIDRMVVRHGGEFVAELYPDESEVGVLIRRP